MSNLPEVERLQTQINIYQEALNDIVNASRDQGLGAMCNWMRGRAVVALTDAYDEKPTPEQAEYEIYCPHSMVKWWCLGCVQGHARRISKENERLESLVQAIEDNVRSYPSGAGMRSMVLDLLRHSEEKPTP